MIRSLLTLALVALVASTQAQQIVYAQDYPVGRGGASKAVSTDLFHDMESGEYLFVISGQQEITFTLFDKDWKEVDSFTHPFVKGSAFSKDGFFTKYTSRNGSKWSAILTQGFDITLEDIDFGARTITVRQNLFMDQDPMKGAEYIDIDGELLVMYFPKKERSVLTVARFDQEMESRSMQMKLQTALPRKKPYTIDDLYTEGKQMYAYLGDASRNRAKVLFYTRPEGMVWSVAYGAEGEISVYDSGTGTRVSSVICSVADLLPAGEKPEKANTATLLVDRTFWVLATTPKGGALGAFDMSTGARIQQFTYGPDTDAGAFAYPPTYLETAPNAGKKLMQKSETVDMVKFCKDLHMGPCALTMVPNEDGLYLLTLATWDTKSVLDGSGGTATSPMIFISTMAGLLVDRKTGAVTANKTTWEEVSGFEQSSKYTKVVAKPSDKEYRQQDATVLKRTRLNKRMHVVYFYKGQMKIFMEEEQE